MTYLLKLVTISSVVALGLMLDVTSQAALVSYVPLDDASGVTLNSGAAITSGSQGKFGEALSLDGSNDTADVTAGSGVSGSTTRTISTWVFQDSGVTGLKTPVSLGLNGTGAKWDLDIDNSDGAIEVGVGNGRNAGSGLGGLVGSWIMVTTTLPSGGGTVGDVVTYLNGTATNASGGTRPINTSDTSLRLGVSANLNIQFFDGLVDDVAVWDEALTDDEILSLFDVGDSLDLSYTAGAFDQLKQVHDAGSGVVTVNGLEWSYASSLTDPAGLTTDGTNYSLVLDATAGTGLTAVIPEPSALLLVPFGSLLVLRRRRGCVDAMTTT